MKKVKVLLILLVMLLLSGCTITRMDKYDYKQVIDKVLSLNIKLYNTVGKGYKYYLPKGIVRTKSADYNDVLKRDNRYYYLYVDVVSYYYKDKIDYKVNKKAYYSKLIDNNGKTGYVEITEVKDKLYVQMVYNYAKIETYVDKSELDSTMSDAAYILSSVDFNDLLLKNLYESGNLNSREEVYNLFDSKDKGGNFLEYIEEYDKYEGDSTTGVTEGEIEVKETTTTTVTTTTVEKATTTSQ